MKIKTVELAGVALDWAVAHAEGLRVKWDERQRVFAVSEGRSLRGWIVPSGPEYREDYAPSTNWSYGGPIIDEHGISLGFDSESWFASTGCIVRAMEVTGGSSGPTPLIAAMRAFVAAKIGDKVEVPCELMPF